MSICNKCLEQLDFPLSLHKCATCAVSPVSRWALVPQKDFDIDLTLLSLADPIIKV
mgnify:CR=1 FL=1